MKKVLVITYYWPPGAGPGVQRWLKFCKFLGDYSWEPIVLTVKYGSYPSHDSSLVNDIPPGLKVFKTKTFEPFEFYNLLKGRRGKGMSVGMIGMNNSKNLLQRFANYIRANFFIPDARKGWNRFAFAKASEIIRDHKPDLIISTGPPHSTHLIALKLRKKFNLPWIADFRDPWVNVYYNRFFPRTDKTKKIDAQLETEVLKNADAVVVVSEGLKNEFRDRSCRIEVLYNGFDEEDFREVTAGEKSKEFVISYVGNFKPNQNVSTLWKVLAEMTSSNAEFKDALRIRLTGNVDPGVLSDISAAGLGSNLNVENFVEHHDAVRRMQMSGLLLFIIPQVKDNELILTGKLFEYMASGSTMLSIGPVAGNAAKIIASCERNSMVDYADEAGIKKNIEAEFNLWQENSALNRPKLSGALMTYSRRGQTEKLAGLMNEILKHD